MPSDREAAYVGPVNEVERIQSALEAHYGTWRADGEEWADVATVVARAIMPEPCARRVRAGEVIGAACPDCGHTNSVHPGTQNPAVESCVLCRLEALTR